MNLDICWEYGYLRWRDPAKGVYLPTHDQEADARIAAEAEREARIAAETEAAQLREQLRRLQGE